MFKRIINIPESNSFFIFGPRGTGKSTLIKAKFDTSKTFYIDLLLYQTENQYAHDPDLLYRQVKALPKEISTIVIDEIQKNPKLLDIEKGVKSLHFTGLELIPQCGPSRSRHTADGELLKLLDTRGHSKCRHPIVWFHFLDEQ